MSKEGIGAAEEKRTQGTKKEEEKRREKEEWDEKRRKEKKKQKREWDDKDPRKKHKVQITLSFQFSQFAVVNVQKYEHKNTGNSKKVLHMGSRIYANSPG